MYYNEKDYQMYRVLVATRIRDHHEKWTTAVGKVVGFDHIKDFRADQEEHKRIANLPVQKEEILVDRRGQTYLKF